MSNQKTGTAGAEGLDYQLNLILVSSIRATKLYGEKFKLRTELKDDGKFDDLVLIYTSKLDGKEYKRFLQAKHKVNEDYNITLGDLLYDAKKKLNLYDYFETYRKLLLQSKDTVLEDIIIFHNLKFNDNVMQFVDPIQKLDDIFHFEDVKRDGTVPAFYRFNLKFREKFKYFKLNKLAEQIILYSHIKKKEMKDSNNYFKDYHNVLAKYVIDVKNKCFHPSFITGDQMTDPTTIVFREILLKEFKYQRNYVDSSNRLNAEEFVIILSGDFGSKPCSAWPNGTTLSEEEMKDVEGFFDHLIFGVNQPNEQELKPYIQNDMKILYDTFEAATDLRVTYFIDKVRDWFKVKKEKDHLSKTEMDKFNECVNQKIEALTLLNISEMFCDELRALHINFQTITFQRKFNSFICDKEKSIFFVQAIKKYTRLSSIKMLQALQNSESKCKFLFISLKKNMMRKIKKLISLFALSKEDIVLAMEVTDDQRDALHFLLDEVFEEQKHKKLIIISDEFCLPAEYHANCERCCDEAQFDHLSEETKVNLLDKEVEFQSYVVSLNEIINENDISSFEFPNWWLPLLSNEEIIIGPELQLSNGYEAEKYIARELFQNTIIPAETIENLKREDIVVSTLKQFKNQVQVNRSRNIHLLKRQNDVFVWRKTHGSISNLRNYINDDTYSYTERSKLYIIAENAGMGKSTIISYFTEKLKETDLSLWVIRFNLIDYTSELSQICEKFKTLAKVHISDVSNFICHEMLKLHTSLEKNLFKMLMTCAWKPRLIFIFDGLDEINEGCKSSVIKIVKKLIANRNVRNIIISTRPHLQVELEDEFSQFAINLHPFNENNKLRYLISYWCDCAHRETGEIQSLDQRKIREKIEIFAEQVLNSFSNAISDYFSQFTGVPLQMRMIAEILENDAMDYIKGESTSVRDWSSVSIINIYEQFIDKKKEIFIKEKSQFNNSNQIIENALKQAVARINYLHAELATNIMLNSKASVGETNVDDIKSMLQFGLVHERNGKLYFIHQTFAEYYITLFLTGKISLPNYDVRQCLVHIINLFFTNIRLFMNDLIIKDIAAYDHLKGHFVSIIRFDTSHLFSKKLLMTNFAPNLNLKILELLLDCIHEIDMEKGSSDIITSLVASLGSFISGTWTIIIKIIIDNVRNRYKGKSNIFKELVSFIIKHLILLLIHPDKSSYEEFSDLVKYFIDFLIFVDDVQYVDSTFIDTELKNLKFVNTIYKGREIFLNFLNYLYDLKLHILEEIIQKNAGFICDPRCSIYFTWLEEKTNISSAAILNLLLPYVIEWMYVSNNYFFILNNYLTTFLNHSKAKYDVEELNSISDPSFTVPFQENFKRFFNVSPCNDMDKILIEFVDKHFGPQSLNHFLQLPDNEISQIEYYCLWNRFERVQYLLEDSNVKSVRKKMVEILKSLKQRSSLDVFNQIISKRNEYKESILQRACRENDTSQLDLISSWIDSDEIFETLTSIKDRSAFFLCSTLLNLINEKFPDRVIEFLFSNSDVYFQEEFYDMAYHPDKDSYRDCCRSLFDSLLNVIEERFNKDNLLKLLTINESVFADICAKMISNDYYKGGVDRLLSIIESNKFNNDDIFRLMSQKSQKGGIFVGLTITSMETESNLSGKIPFNSSSICDFMRKYLKKTK